MSTTSPAIIMIGTFDSKGEEFALLRRLILGADTVS